MEEPVVPVYSIAKPYTAAAACLSFDLDDEVGAVLPRLPAALAPLTIRSLLAHRSGLDDYGAWPDYVQAVADRRAPWPEEDVLERARLSAPGRFRYSNIGYLLVRLALEARHGGSFHEVLDRLVLRPLGLFTRPFATSADWQGCEHPAIDGALRSYHPGWVYTGTFAASVGEAARGLALIMRGVLGSAVPAAMTQTSPVSVPADHPLAPDAGYGLGLMTCGSPADVVGHGGGGPGFALFAAASADGSRWSGAAEAAGRDADELMRSCVAEVRETR